jgi:Flp pilus assembly pilin Flp
MRRRRGGFAMAEYAAFIGIIVAALISMAVYMKRAMMGRYKEVGDAFGHGRQFQPGVTTDANGVLIQ